MGCAAVIFFTVLAYRVHREPLDRPMADALATVGKLAGVMLAVNLFFTIWRMVTLAVGGTHELLVRDALVSGPFAFNFWALEVGLGMILPFALILWSAGKRIGPIFLASALVIFSSFFCAPGHGGCGTDCPPVLGARRQGVCQTERVFAHRA